MRKLLLIISLFSVACSFGQTPLHLLIPKNASAPFNPGNVTGLTLSLFADNIGGLSDGDPVSTWTDQSTSATNATSSGTNRPLYKTNIVNGKPIVRFDGSNDYMLVTSPVGMTNRAGFTVFVVMKATTLAASKAIFTLWDYQTNGCWSLNTSDISSSNFQMFIANALNDDGARFMASTDAAATNTDFAVWTIVYDGGLTNTARVKFYKNGTLLTTNVTGTMATTLTNATANLYLANFGGTLLNTRNYGFDAYAFLTYNNAVSGSDITYLVNGLKAAIGL